MARSVEVPVRMMDTGIVRAVIADLGQKYAESTARAIAAETQIQAVRDLHRPDDENRCQACLGTYDPMTGRAVQTMWPCPTIEVMKRGEGEAA